MADEPNQELINLLADNEKPTLADLLQGRVAGWWNDLGGDMRAKASKSQTELLKDFALQALMQAPMGLGSRGGAMAGRDSVIANSLHKSALRNQPADPWKLNSGYDWGVTGGGRSASPFYGSGHTSLNHSVEGLVMERGVRPSLRAADDLRLPMQRASRLDPANSVSPFEVLPGGKK